MSKLNYKPPKLAGWILEKLSLWQNRSSSIGDVEELYGELADDFGKKSADRWYWKQTINSIPHLLNIVKYWGEMMFKNYTKISLRNISKHKLFSFINIFGLTVGIISCLFIYLYIQYETSFDTFHQDSDRIYRISMIKRTEAKTLRWSVNSAMLAPSIRNSYPEIESIGRITDGIEMQVKYEEKVFYEKASYGDSQFFEIYNVPFIEGQKKDILDRPGTVILTKEIKEKYFGKSSAIGKSLKIDSSYFEITGVVEKTPSNSHLKFDMVISMESAINIWWYDDWPTGTSFTYVKLKENYKADEFENKIKLFANQYSDSFNQAGVELEYFLQPIKDIHLFSNLDFEQSPPGNPTYVYIFMVVGFLILIIACMNFINLSTAKSANRSNEVGVRKTIGALQGQLVNQFLYESIIISIIATISALVLSIPALQLFNYITGVEYLLDKIFNPFVISVLFIFSIFLGITAGIYPAIFISSFKPSSIIKGNLSQGSRNPIFRKILVIIQFTISIILIIGTIVIFKQIDFMQNTNLGFEKEQLMVLTFPENSFLEKRYETIKSEFMESPNIKGATASSHIPGKELTTARIYKSGKESETGMSIYFIDIDHDFFDVFGIDIIEGRKYNKEMGDNGILNGLILNAAAVRAFGYTELSDAIGDKFWRRNVPLVGITNDFHFRGLQNEVSPLFMGILPTAFKYITLKTTGNNIRETVRFIEAKWKELFPEEPLQYFFVDSEFDKLYKSEEQTGNLFSLFSLLGLFIATLGLFGLTSFVVEQRKKEIGIRKVLGAKVSSIVQLVSNEFLVMITISNIIAWPIAYFLLDSWLNNFAYKMSIGIDIFLLAGTFAFLLAGVTIGTQAYKAAYKNPVTIIRET